MNCILIRPLCLTAYGFLHSVSLKLLLFLFCCNALAASAQDTTATHNPSWRSDYITAVNKKAATFNQRLDRSTDKTLSRIIRQEKDMQAQVAKKDSAMAHRLFGWSIDSLQRMRSALTTGQAQSLQNSIPGARGEYFPYLDTLRQSLAFITKGTTALGQLNGMENRLTVIRQLNEYLAQRQATLTSYTNLFPELSARLSRVRQQTALYQAQVNEYKETLKSPEKIEKLAMNTLQQLPAFQKFMQQHSQLAGIFASPNAFTNSGAGASGISGLSSRALVQQSIGNALPGGGALPGGAAGAGSGANVNGFIQQQTGAAQDALNQYKDKLNAAGGMKDQSIDDSSNAIRAKPLGKRLEFGADVQFGKSTNYLPASTDLALTAGYKLNARSSAGIGLSYKLGMGEGWNKINFTSQGVGFRTYLQWKFKAGLFLQGSGEWKYMTGFRSVQQLRNVNAWQTSALLSLGKSYKVSRKLSGNIQLAYDFLYKQHLPNTQPLLFRLGYNL